MMLINIESLQIAREIKINKMFGSTPPPVNIGEKGSPNHWICSPEGKTDPPKGVNASLPLRYKGSDISVIFYRDNSCRNPPML